MKIIGEVELGGRRTFIRVGWRCSTEAPIWPYYPACVAQGRQPGEQEPQTRRLFHSACR